MYNMFKVSAIFNDPSLNSNMTLVINQLYLYEEKDAVIKIGNARKSLHAVNKWNYRHLMNLTTGKINNVKCLHSVYAFLK